MSGVRLRTERCAHSDFVRHPETDGGKKGLQIRLEIDQNTFEREIPDRVEGIPTEVIEPRERKAACCGTNNCYVNNC